MAQDLSLFQDFLSFHIEASDAYSSKQSIILQFLDTLLPRITQFFVYFPGFVPSAMADGFLGPAFAFAGAIAKLTQLGFELAAVEDDLLVFRDTLEHDKERLEFVRTERCRKFHLLEPRILGEIDSVLQSCQRACDSITALVDEPLTRVKKKGRVNLGQRVEWVFCDSALARALNDYRQTTHVSLMSVWTFLLHLQPQQSALSPFSTYSKNVFPMQYNEHDQDLIQSAPKPQYLTIRAKSSPHQIGEIPVEETFPKEYESAGQGHGVVNRSQSAGLLSYKSKEHVGENEPSIGSILALREIALSRRHGLGPALEKK